MEKMEKSEVQKEIEPEIKEPDLFPCFLCGELVEIKYSKRDKPYFICDPCGVQAFIRRDKGIKRLKKLTGDKVIYNLKFKSTANQVLNGINQLEQLRAKLGEIEGKARLTDFNPVKERLKAGKAIQGEIKRLERTLFKKG